MTIGLKELSRELAKASKVGNCQPITIQDADYVIRILIELMTHELVQPEGKVEIENFLVLHNQPYIKSDIQTRTIKVRVSPQLKKRLKANLPT